MAVSGERVPSGRALFGRVGVHLALWAVAVDEHLAVPLRCLSASLALRASEGPANAQPEPRP